MASRLNHFIQMAARATTAGNVFDDAATGQGLLNFFLRALNCGAVDEAEAGRLTTLTRGGVAQWIVLEDFGGEEQAVAHSMLPGISSSLRHAGTRIEINQRRKALAPLIA